MVVPFAENTLAEDIGDYMKRLLSAFAATAILGLSVLPLTPQSIAQQELPQPRQTMAVHPLSPTTVIEASVSFEVVPTPTPTPQPTARAITGSKYDWLRASGIPEHEWKYVDFLVTHESGWNPNAVNQSSGACGLGQQLPCGKWPHQWNDPVGALIDMNSYVHNRYRGWYNAYLWWTKNRWY